MFDPAKYLMKYKGQDYLEVKWRLVWFRERFPHGSLVTEEMHVDLEKGYARLRATAMDGEGGLAMGTGTEWRKNMPKGMDDDFLEKAETRAIGRALAALGIGTQFVGQDFGEGQHIADAPMTTTNEASSSNAPQARVIPNPPVGTPGMKLPTIEVDALLNFLSKVYQNDERAWAKVREVMQIPAGQECTRARVRLTLTRAQHDQLHADAEALVKAELNGSDDAAADESRAVATDEDDVPTYSPPDGAAVSQDERSPETHSSGPEKTAFAHESARPLHDEIGPEGIDGISDTSPTTIEMDDGFPKVEVDDEGFVTPPGIELLVKRAQSFNAMAMLRKLRADEPRLTIGRYRYCWEQVGKK